MASVAPLQKSLAGKKPTSSFEQTLQFITSIKLEELEKQRLAYQVHSKLIETHSDLPPTRANLIAKVELLASMIKLWSGPGKLTDPQCMVIGGKLELGNLDFWLQQARQDPIFNIELLKGWGETLETHIKHSNMRFDAAKLFGMLCNEWLKSGDSSTMEYQGISEDGPGDEEDLGLLSDGSYDHVELENEEIVEQKDKLRSMIFEECPVDAEALTQYMERLFASEEAKVALNQVRGGLQWFGYRLRQMTITKVDVKNAIQGLLASALMNEEQRVALKEFYENDLILKEVASVMNMRLSSLETWAWPKKGLTVDMRRHLNDRFRAFTDPEIIDGLLLHHLGVAWQVQLKQKLREVFDSSVWIRRTEGHSDSVRKRCVEQLTTLWNKNGGAASVNHQRQQTQRNIFFLSKLHKDPQSINRYDDLVDVQDSKLQEQENSPAFVKQKVLHILTTECYLSQSLHGSHAMIRSDLEWFGPSLPHKAILVVLAFLGIPQDWLSFFHAFLSTPIQFPEDPDPRMRKRGTPISYALSVVCGEAMLFIMDFAVNQRANGLFLYRMHDDMWLWDSDVKNCVNAWEEMNKYAGLVGMKFNQKKTGSAYLGPDTDDARLLPKGDIRWGFLTFDLEKSRFIVDQKQVDVQIQELRRRLGFTKSVFGWVNAYNKYMSYFFRNFGGAPANCFGQEHMSDIIDTFTRIQHDLFPELNQGPLEHLRMELSDRFDIHDLPDGYFYLPIAYGGLELRNVLLSLFAMQKWGRPLFKVQFGTPGSMPPGPHRHIEYLDVDNAPAQDKFKNTVVNDRKEYIHLKATWEKGAVTGSSQFDASTRGWAGRGRGVVGRARGGGFGRGMSRWDVPAQDIAPREDFMSLEEYLSFRESWLITWGKVYSEMLETPKAKDLVPVPVVSEQLQSAGFFASKVKSWGNLDWYEKWLVSMYGEEVVKRFGRLEIVDENLIPVGMVELFRTSKMRLQG